jgi:hypothetical protein
MLHVTTSAKGSGVFNQDINDWLREIENLGDENVYRQLEKAQIQQQEILFHLQRLSRMTQLYVNATDSKLPEVQASLGVALQQIAEFLTA